MKKALAAFLLLPVLAAAANAQPANEKPGPKDKAAYKLAYGEGLKRFNEACKTAGKSMPPSTTRVPGIRLEVAPGSIDRDWPFAGMPRERTGDRFIASFLDFTFNDSERRSDSGQTGMLTTMIGFHAVDVLQKDGTYVRYRLKGKTPHEGMVKEPVARDRAFRHVVSIEPLPIAGGRQHWVGGSRIRVVDGETGRVMGEVRAVSFAVPPEGVKASELDKRSWEYSVSCPKYLDIQTAMARMSILGIIDPPPYSAGRADPGTTSLEAAVERGLLREAKWSDVDAWQAAARAARPKTATRAAGSFDPDAARSREPFRAYVVLKAFVLPAGLSGAHSAEFYVPRGVPRPTGDPGHSTVLDFNTMVCEGPDCARR